MVQRNRLSGGIKAFKMFIEDFLQPLSKIAIDTFNANISETQDILEKVLELVVKAEDKSRNKQLFDCNKCDGKFKCANDLEKHITNHVKDSNISKRELSTSPGNRSQKISGKFFPLLKIIEMILTKNLSLNYLHRRS